MIKPFLFILILATILIFIFVKCTFKSTPSKEIIPKEKPEFNITPTKKEETKTPQEITGSFHFGGTPNLEEHIQNHFAPFFKKHKITLDSTARIYKNDFAELHISASDHRYIDMTFRKKGEEYWFNLYTYLKAFPEAKTISISKKIYEEYQPTTLDELAEGFVKIHSQIAEAYLNAPFEGDFSWEKNYWKTKKLYEYLNTIPRDSEIYKLFKAQDSQWKVLAEKELKKSNN